MFISEMLKSLDKRKTPKLRDFSRVNLASPAGFEPTTFRLGGGRSILLSYGDIICHKGYHTRSEPVLSSLPERNRRIFCF